MAKVQRAHTSSARTFHGLVTVLLLVAGAGLLGYGLYRRIKKSDTFDLNVEVKETKTLDSLVSFLLRFNLVLILVGAVLILSGIISILAQARNCAGSVFRFVFFFMAVAIFVVLAGLSAGSFYALARKDSGVVFDAFENAWVDSVGAVPEDVCALENKYKCRGFADNDCKTCPTGVGSVCTKTALTKCAPCTVGSSEYVGNGCWGEFDSRLRSFYIVMGAVGAVLAAIALIDIFVLCAL
jgi:Tetraspanin family